MSLTVRDVAYAYTQALTYTHTHTHTLTHTPAVGIDVSMYEGKKSAGDRSNEKQSVESEKAVN